MILDRNSDQDEFFDSTALSTEEAAEMLGISRSTAKREWNVAKAWLARQMKRGSRGETKAVGKN